jgi:sugar O-acyltransferase (sialic acid O-acetyltransferase NeuD family)
MNRIQKQLVIFGTAEIAKLAQYYFDNDSDYKVVAFTVDDDFANSKTFNGLPLVPFSELVKRYPPIDFELHVALSYAQLNRFREEKYNQAKLAGYRLASYISSKSVVWPNLAVGDNCFILEGQIIQPEVYIGDNVMIWSGNHLGHGSIIGSHTYISSHVVISGNCKIGKRNFFGVNSTVKDFSLIGDDCFIAMGAAVTKDMRSGSVAIAASTLVYEESDRRAAALKRMYFKIK